MFKAYLPLGKGISILASLSAGFAPDNSTPGRFFAYTATTGKINYFAFSDSGFSSALETKFVSFSYSLYFFVVFLAC
jgi:hypothetical protein